MRQHTGPVRTLSIVIGVLRIGNLAFLPLAALALAGSFVWARPLLAHLHRQYGVSGDAALLYMRALTIAIVPLVYIVERLFRALAEMVETIRSGDPFAGANAARLRIVGWTLLAIQALDAMFGMTTFWAKAQHIRVLDWTPSFTGWLGVLVAFVLARVFAEGAAMRDELDGTV